MRFDSFEGAEITIYTQGGNQFNFDLSQMQAFMVLKILGFKFGKGDNYSCYSDQALEKFFDMTTNPLRLKEKDQE
jgi:hypothetical protein